MQHWRDRRSLVPLECHLGPEQPNAAHKQPNNLDTGHVSRDMRRPPCPKHCHADPHVCEICGVLTRDGGPRTRSHPRLFAKLHVMDLGLWASIAYLNLNAYLKHSSEGLNATP